LEVTFFVEKGDQYVTYETWHDYMFVVSAPNSVYNINCET